MNKFIATPEHKRFMDKVVYTLCGVMLFALVILEVFVI